MGKQCCVVSFVSVKQKLSEQMGVLEFYSKQRNEVSKFLPRQIAYNLLKVAMSHTGLSAT